MSCFGGRAIIVINIDFLGGKREKKKELRDFVVYVWGAEGEGDQRFQRENMCLGQTTPPMRDHSVLSADIITLYCSSVILWPIRPFWRVAIVFVIHVGSGRVGSGRSNAPRSSLAPPIRANVQKPGVPCRAVLLRVFSRQFAFRRVPCKIDHVRHRYRYTHTHTHRGGQVGQRDWKFSMSRRAVFF